MWYTEGEGENNKEVETTLVRNRCAQENSSADFLFHSFLFCVYVYVWGRYFWFLLGSFAAKPPF